MLFRLRVVDLLWIKLPLTDPVNTTIASYRIFRGGGYTEPPSYLRSAERYYHFQDARQANVGFRLARQP